MSDKSHPKDPGQTAYELTVAHFGDSSPNWNVQTAAVKAAWRDYERDLRQSLRHTTLTRTIDAP